jgi:glycosyltransferase involved in cell wall biosynthesis
VIERLRILAFSFFPAFVPPNNGGVERLYNFYAELSQYHDVTLISSSFLNGEREVVRHLPSFMEVRIPKDDHFAVAYTKLSKTSSEGDVSGPALGASLKSFGALHDEYLKHYTQSDVIVHDSPFLIDCDLFRGYDSKPRIYNSYNCETDLYSSFNSRGGEEGAIPTIVRELEEDLCRNADLITVCSDEDAAAFQRHFSPTGRFTILPNGYVPGTPPSGTRDPRCVVFLGSSHKPNVDAVRQIVEDIAPKMPDVEFHLIGSCRAAGKARNVIAHGVIPQEAKERLLRRAGAAINPITSGGGSSLKIADIASNGCPLFSTELGARGFGLKSGVHYVPLGTNEVVQTIRASLGDVELLNRVATNALTHFEQHYTWRRIVALFVEELSSLATRHATLPKPKLVLNDYDSLDNVGGGATRTQGLCRGLSQTSRVLFLAFASDNKPRRRLSSDGRILSLLVDKSPEHQAEHEQHDLLHWVSTADIVNYVHAPENARLMALFRCAASFCSTIICEHPYMVGLPRMFDVEFIYSSQNFEAKLKGDGLRHHPLNQRLRPLVHEAESFACAASTFIVAVSEADAMELGAAYRSTAPILVVPNGAEGRIVSGIESAQAVSERPIAVFMGSMHGPNFEAARWITAHLAPSLPQYDFTFIGSIADSLTGQMPTNVRLIGQLSSLEKSRHLDAAHVALNPMMSGSGSNVKMADYLQHGLPVLTTAFGARGYDWVPRSDAIVLELAEFEGELRRLLEPESTSEQAREARRASYSSTLSMEAGGARLARLIEEHEGPRKRALYVTYRYNEPARGGGEEYVVRLVHALAASGWEVDVASPAAERITDVNRFSAVFSGPDCQPIPTGQARVRSTKFPLDAMPAAHSAVQRVWNYQADYEEHVAKSLTPPRQACMAWGWADAEAEGRWCFRSAGLYVPEGGVLRLRARPLAPLWLQIFTQDGRRLHSAAVEGDLDFSSDIPAGFLSLRLSMKEVATIDDPRPLALFVTELRLDGHSLLEDHVRDLWEGPSRTEEKMAALAAAREAIRDLHGLELSSLRSASDALDKYVRERVADYDLLITHNAVFKGTTAAVHAAAAHQVPSILIPHLHYDDDFYHFRDIQSACATASVTLVSPLSVKQLMVEQGLENVIYHSPGVDVSAEFSSDDVAAFRNVLPEPVGEFFLILGRKTAAKGYRDAIQALQGLPSDGPLMIVMIGPDDDGVLIDDPRVVYLGRQPDAVVRGALRECLGLINMSRSESFGMVLLEAGLAGKPVLANRSCAAFADIIEDGVNGFLVSRGELSTVMLRLQSEPALRTRLGKEARRRAKNYDWKKVEKEFVRICNSLVVSQ